MTNLKEEILCAWSIFTNIPRKDIHKPTQEFFEWAIDRTRTATLESVREVIKSMKAEFPRYMIIENNARESVAAIVHEVKQQLLKALQTLPTEDSNEMV